MENKLVSIIILNLNGYEITRDCLRSVEKNTVYPNYEILLIDNGSTDGSAERLKAEFPQIHLLKNEFNKGFAYGVNQGYREGRGHYLFHLNNDTEVTEGWIEEALKTLESDPKIALAGCTEINKEQLDDPHALRKLKGRRDRTVMTVPVAWVLRKKTIEEIGYLDAEHFSPIYGEEMDWNYRARSKGYKIMRSARCLIAHYHSVTSKANLGKEKTYLLANTHRLRSMLINLNMFQLVRYAPGLALIFFNSFREGLAVALLKSYWRNILDLPMIMEQRRRRKKNPYIPFLEPVFTPPFEMKKKS
ncbi:MAG: glycosyltransferase family 2 protein [Nitrospinae bacterium]|nr:glycosyltransferase family 2 protein [Nitrospinota bacterium]